MDKYTLEEGDVLNIDFQKRGGLIPVIVQNFDTKEILMLGYANEEAVKYTLETELATFWSTSRNELWTKGKTSGEYLLLKSIWVDCDQDALIYQVIPQGNGACHTKNKSGRHRSSCFYRYYQNQKLVFKEGED